LQFGPYFVVRVEIKVAGEIELYELTSEQNSRVSYLMVRDLYPFTWMDESSPSNQPYETRKTTGRGFFPSPLPKLTETTLKLGSVGLFNYG
jgi:hypothetical protein